MFGGTEWISYEDERSIECKAKYIKDNGFGGAMIFSLNTDDFSSYCKSDDESGWSDSKTEFPLVRKINSVLLNENNNNK